MSLIAYHDTFLVPTTHQLTHAHLNPTTGVQLLLAMSFSLLLDPEGMATFDVELTRALQAMRTPNEKYVYLGEGEEGQAVSLVIPFLSIALPTPSLDASNTLTEAHRCLLSAEECREHRVATTQLLSYQVAADRVKAYTARNSKDEATRQKILLYLQERMGTTTYAIQTINNAMVARHEALHGSEAGGGGGPRLGGPVQGRTQAALLVQARDQGLQLAVELLPLRPPTGGPSPPWQQHRGWLPPPPLLPLPLQLPLLPL